MAKVPAPGTPLILTVEGGETLIEGVTVRSGNPNYGPLRDGGYYLMFLSPSRQPEPGRYEIFHGGIFEVTQDRVKPLVKTPDIVYKQSVDERRPEFIARIKKAVSER